MKKRLIATLAAVLVSGAALADSTHVCQGNSCNDNGTGGGSAPITVTGTVNGTNTNTVTANPTAISGATAITGPVTATGVGIGGTGVGVGGNATAVGGNATIQSGAVHNHNAVTNTNQLTNRQDQSQQQSQTQSATATSSSGGNTLTTGSQAVNVQTGAQTVEVNTNVRPAASAPANSLTSVGTDNCLGSVSGSFGNGFISFGGGTTTESVECNRRANSRRLEQLGYRRAAVTLQCLNDEVRASMKLAGTPCPQDEARQKEAAVSVSSDDREAYRRPADPFICARTGEQC